MIQLLSKNVNPKFESKSQPIKATNETQQVVIKERKSKVWKQITTVIKPPSIAGMLLSKNVNPKFESKSQPA